MNSEHEAVLLQQVPQVWLSLHDEGTTNPDKFALHDCLPGLVIRAEVSDALTGSHFVLYIDWKDRNTRGLQL